MDPRRFGRIFAMGPENAATLQHPFFVNLGPEPLEESFDLAKHFFAESRHRKIHVKSFIMNNQVVVGVGNIYASEALWRAKISPHRQARSLTKTETGRLAGVIRDTLRDAIEAGGTTIRDYRSSDNKGGNFQNLLAVYGRDNQKCSRCNALIVLATQSARSSYFCPVCQK